jgi:hypothetical protein
MKNLLGLILILMYVNTIHPQDIILEGNFTEDLLLTPDKTYLLKSFVRIQSPATLRIEAGTIIYGDYISQGTLVICSGAKIIAEGTNENPIVFTSEFNKVGSTRKPGTGDWGGIIILGNAPINVPDGTVSIEGSGDLYGGNNPYDSSGVLRYIRIEYAGLSLTLSNKINAITFGGVGSKTIVENIQSSFSSDDSFGWFGGTVNCKKLVSYKTRDDDFDFDFGYSGNLQFLLCIRDKDAADVSGSNGFESDNDGSGSVNEPRTSPVVYNATIIGPAENSQTIFSGSFRRGMHIRRSSRGKYYNTLIMGWSAGILVEGLTTAKDAQENNWFIKNSIVAGSVDKDLDTVRTDGSFDISNWFLNNNNRTFPENSKVKLIAPFDSIKPNVMPSFDSPVLTGAAVPPNDGFFDSTAEYVGAFGNNNWLEEWTKFDYDINTAIKTPELLPELFSLEQNFPNPFNPSTTISYSIPYPNLVILKIYDILGNEITTLVNEEKPAGNYKIKFDASLLSSGIYFYRLQAGNFTATKNLVLLK